MIEAFRVQSIKNYLSPIAESWKDCVQYNIKLQPVPIKAITTSKYIRETIEERKIGKIKEVKASFVIDSEAIAIRLEWKDLNKNDKVESYRDFVDACAVMFPIKPGASVMTMGSEEAPVNIWFWRADGKFYDVISRGLGTTQRRKSEKSGLRCFWHHDGIRWGVVFTRLLASDAREFVDLSPPKETGVAFAVWEGGNRERGPLKAYSGDFITFILR